MCATADSPWQRWLFGTQKPIAEPVTVAIRKTKPIQIIGIVCLAQALAMLGVFFWPALVPGLSGLWQLTASECGWITAIFYAGYMLAVPVLAPLTDRHDSRLIYLIGAGFAVSGHLILACFADGFWVALLGRFLAGVGGAGTQMVGLKLMVERLPPDSAQRAVALQAASILLSTAFSFVCADISAREFGLTWSFFVPSAAASMAGILVLFGTSPYSPEKRAACHKPSLIPVFRDQRVMAHIMAYGLHSFAFNALRGWSVPFLAFAMVQQNSELHLTPAFVATVMGLLAAGSSYAGSEMALKIGHSRLLRVAMLGAAVFGVILATSAGRDYVFVLAVLTAFYMFVSLDLSVLTGVVAKLAEPTRQGMTLAVHSFVGYAGSFVGPVIVGLALDYFKQTPAEAWSVAFVMLATADMAALVILRRWAAPSVISRVSTT
jgi:predicted MFS family arabinose efflux permease